MSNLDYNYPYCPHDRSVTNAGNRQGPFTYEFMTPEEKEDYGSGTIFIRVSEDPTEIKKSFIVEQVIYLSIIYNVEKQEGYLLERRLWAD